MDLQILVEQIKNCSACSLSKTRVNAVPGEGNPESEIVFIGEGPGRNEDLQGRPFVGAAGKLLSELLESVGWAREDVFITNIVKCRPPGNRDPRDDEVAACAGLYLWNQLDVIRPLFIATLGRHSMYRFLPKDFKISLVHGQLKETTNKKTGRSFYVLPLYHPAAALYNGSMRQTLFDDFAKIPKILEKIKKLGNRE